MGFGVCDPKSSLFLFWLALQGQGRNRKIEKMWGHSPHPIR